MTSPATSVTSTIPSLPCIYCRGCIPASAFAFWSPGRRLLSADCPDCARTMTLAAHTWRRWCAAPSVRTGRSGSAS